MSTKLPSAPQPTLMSELKKREMEDNLDRLMDEMNRLAAASPMEAPVIHLGSSDKALDELIASVEKTPPQRRTTKRKSPTRRP